MYTVPPAPRKQAKEKTSAGRNRSVSRVTQIILTLWAVFWLYVCLVVGVKVMELMGHFTQNLGIANHKVGLIRVENSSSTSAVFPEQLDIIDVTQFHNDSWPGMSSLDVGQGEEAFNDALGNGNASRANVEFVGAAENQIASLKNYSGTGDFNNMVPAPELVRVHVSTAGVTTNMAVNDFKNESLASDPVFNESSTGVNSKSSDSIDDGDTSKTTTTEPSPAFIAALRANSAGSTSLAARLASYAAAAPEEA
ncbi:hypothetical protein R5R35_003417 [Gryllus longicercus]|uniref:Uncharacterized protein n=1 Tax=Gryllus longicercus TaxID=2509291 RepID=A0AAN9VJV8_9ORTH